MNIPNSHQPYPASSGWRQERGLQSILNFGSNPGNLQMMLYIPENIPEKAPLVLVLHGCTQEAMQFAAETGWNELADKYKFYVVYAAQKAINNPNKCLNWFELADTSRDRGEVYSLKQMADYVKTHYSLNERSLHVTGLSAGGAMATALLANYPQLFRSGAIMAGLPFHAATSLREAYSAMRGEVKKTPDQWGELVRKQNPAYQGPYPRLAVFHGSSDQVVALSNAFEIVAQWTNLHRIHKEPSYINRVFDNNRDVMQRVYHNPQQEAVVLMYEINQMGHGISVYPGKGPRQGGRTGKFAFDKEFFSSFWAAHFFGLIA